MRRRIHPIWWLVGISLCMGLVRVGASQTASTERHIAPVGAGPPSEIVGQLARLDGVTEHPDLSSYGRPFTMLQVSCAETPEEIAGMVVAMTQYDRDRGYKLTHLDMLNGFYDMVSASPQKTPRDCTAIYSRYMQ